MEVKKPKLVLVGLTFVAILVPWFNTELGNNFSVPEVSQEDVTFYEINPCKISLFQFVSNNSESLYQNHYFFRPDNSSSIKCFGRISGVTVLQKGVETQFFISVGTSSLLNLIFQAVIWIILFSFIPKNNKKIVMSEKVKYKNLIILAVSYLLTFSIHAENRFYDKSLYIFEFNNFNSYLLIFLMFIFIVKNFVDTFQIRSNSIMNYLPYLFLFTGIFSGYNLVLYSIIFLFYGLVSLTEQTGSKIFNSVFLILSLWWLYNAKGSFFFSPGKIRGFTSSIFEFNASLFWIIFSFLLLKGLWKVYTLNKDSFSILLFTKNLSLVSFFLILFGNLGSNFPIINFFNYYFFGLQRYGVDLNNPFAFDEFLVKISWRGLFPSSETIGEFYGICLMFILFVIIKNKQLTKLHYLGIFSSALGLYFSDNRTAIILIFFIIIFSYLRTTKFYQIQKYKIAITTISIGLLLLTFTLQSETWAESYKFMSESMIFKARVFQFDSIYSSFLLLANNPESSVIFSSFLSFFGFVSYLLNRSEMWGLFIARYNPTFSELLIGSGPLNFGQLYGETVINSPESFLLPHSSVLSYVVFIGILPLALLGVFFLYLLLKNRHNYNFVAFSLYVFINIFKNDSLNYFSTFTLYALLFLLLCNRVEFNDDKSTLSPKI